MASINIFSSDGFVQSNSRNYLALDCDTISAQTIDAQLVVREQPNFSKAFGSGLVTDATLAGFPTPLTEATLPTVTTTKTLKQAVLRFDAASPAAILTESAAEIVASLQGRVGDSISFTVYDINAVPPVHVISGGAGVTLVGSALIDGSASYRLTVVNNTIGSESVLLHRI